MHLESPRFHVRTLSQQNDNKDGDKENPEQRERVGKVHKRETAEVPPCGLGYRPNSLETPPLQASTGRNRHPPSGKLGIQDTSALPPDAGRRHGGRYLFVTQRM